MSVRFLHDGRKTIFLEYTYENLEDHVEPDDIKKYMEALEKTDSKFSYVLSYSVDDNAIISSTRKNNRHYKKWTLCQCTCFVNDWWDHLVDFEKMISFLQSLIFLIPVFSWIFGLDFPCFSAR